ncbi:MAG: high-potential iron-sulfur protein, partial [Aquisalimonadaceae bacterium]
VPWASVQASDLPRVSEDDSTAKNLKYVHDAASSDARKNSNEFCHNCRYFKGTQSTEWERCDIFPGKAVAAEGWCNVWVAK